MLMAFWGVVSAKGKDVYASDDNLITEINFTIIGYAFGNKPTDTSVSTDAGIVITKVEWVKRGPLGVFETLEDNEPFACRENGITIYYKIKDGYKKGDTINIKINGENVAAFDHGDRFFMYLPDLDSPCTEHVPGSWVEGNGNHYKFCTVCGIMTDLQSCTYKHKVIKEASCTESGLEGDVCTVCGHVSPYNKKVIPINGVHQYSEKITKANLTDDGKIEKECSLCGDTPASTIIYHPEKYELSETSYIYDTTEKTPKVKITDIKGNVIDESEYQLKYTNNIEVGTATVEIIFNGKYYTGEKSLTFEIKTAATPTPVPTKDPSEVTPTPVPTSGKFAQDDISPENPAKVADIEKTILSIKNEKDTKGSTFTLLKAKGVPKSKKSIKLSWSKVPGAEKYMIFGNKCGKKNKYITTVTGTSYTAKKLKKGTYYKYTIVAVKGDEAIATSKTIHVVTDGGKTGNNTKVKLSKSKLTLNVGKSKTIKATLKSKKKVSNHRKVAWESDDLTVAKVNSKGKITAVGKGSCYVYAYAQNGVAAKIKITVK